MKKQQFAERQFEVAANIELARGIATPFVPTQNLEWYLGFDAAHDPQRVHAIWRILCVHVPKRMPLSPEIWPMLPHHFHDEIPGRYVSLFMQYKSATYQDHRRAKHFSHIGKPYFQVPITYPQQQRLRTLETNVRQRAVVRYAAPAFWSRTHFDEYDERREILKHCAYTSPAKVASHRRWMYENPTSKAFFNSEFEAADGESWDTLVTVLSERSQRESLRSHIHALAIAIAPQSFPDEQRGELQWTERLRRYGQFENQDIELIIDMSRISLAAIDIDTSWVILLQPDAAWSHINNNEHYWPRRWWMYW